jgi:hypothetical protein
MAAPADTAAIYEKLRSAVLSGEAATTPGLGILHRQGVAAWIRTLGQEPHAEATSRHCEPVRCANPDPSPPASDVTRLIAGIIVSLALEHIHA